MLSLPSRQRLDHLGNSESMRQVHVILEEAWVILPLLPCGVGHFKKPNTKKIFNEKVEGKSLCRALLRSSNYLLATGTTSV